MPIRLAPLSALCVATVLVISGCATSGGDVAASADSPEAVQRDFRDHGFIDRDLTAIAARINADLPAAQAIRSASKPAVQLREADVRTIGDSVVLDRRAFVRRLLGELQHQASNGVSYVAQDENALLASRNSLMSGGGRGKSSGSSSGGGSSTARGASRGRDSATVFDAQAPAAFQLEIEISRPTDSTQSNAQNYAFTVRERVSGRPVWQGAFLIDAPEQVGEHVPKK